MRLQHSPQVQACSRVSTASVPISPAAARIPPPLPSQLLRWRLGLPPLPSFALSHLCPCPPHPTTVRDTHPGGSASAGPLPGPQAPPSTCLQPAGGLCLPSSPGLPSRSGWGGGAGASWVSPRPPLLAGRPSRPGEACPGHCSSLLPLLPAGLLLLPTPTPTATSALPPPTPAPFSSLPAPWP